jgi:hypothetical protein
MNANADTGRPRDCSEKKRPTVDFLPQNAQFFWLLYAMRWPMRISTPSRERQANAHTVDRADERVICKDISRLGMGCT